MIDCFLISYFSCFVFIAGVGYLLRKVGNSLSPTIWLSKDGDNYQFTTESTFKNTVINFKLGEEFDEETIDGRNVKSVVTLDGNTLTHKQGGDKPSTITRTFSATECVVKMILGDIVCDRVYNVV